MMKSEWANSHRGLQWSLMHFSNGSCQLTGQKFECPQVYWGGTCQLNEPIPIERPKALSLGSVSPQLSAAHSLGPWVSSTQLHPSGTFRSSAWANAGTLNTRLLTEERTCQPPHGAANKVSLIVGGLRQKPPTGLPSPSSASISEYSPQSSRQILAKVCIRERPFPDYLQRLLFESTEQTLGGLPSPPYSTPACLNRMVSLPLSLQLPTPHLTLAFQFLKQDLPFISQISCLRTLSPHHTHTLGVPSAWSNCLFTWLILTPPWEITLTPRPD